jgi:ATP-binding cassette subfamily C protein CydD
MRPLDPRLLRYASAARGYLAVTVGLGLAVTALVLAQATLLAHLLATATAGLVPAWPAVVGLLAVVAARAAASYGGEAAALRAAAVVKSQLRRRLVGHALRLGPAWLAGQPAGELTTLTTRGLDALDGYFARYLPQLVLACLTPLAVLAVVGGADWLSAVVIAVTLPLIPIFMILVGLHTKARTERQWRLLARLGGHFLDVVEGLPTLKVFNRAKAQVEVIRRVSEAHRAATMRTLRVAFLSALVLELLATLAVALVAVEVGLRLLAGGLDYQTALVVLLLAPEAYLPLRAVGAQFHASMEGVAAAEQAFTVLDTPPPTRPDTGPTSACTADPATGVIRFDQVGLVYPGRNRPALRDVSLCVAPGERVAIVGPSGAGKSSLLALLLRFTDPTFGRIVVGEVDLARLDVAAWRRRLAWVPQRPHLFAGSVADNIRLGDPDVPLDDVRRAARLANADEFVAALPRGYDTPLGEHARLSAGQRQRIALARAFLRDAPLLLLDEPTAHLDPANASAVRDAVERLMDGRTVLIVTHTDGWARAADRVITLEDGQVHADRAMAAELLSAR